MLFGMKHDFEQRLAIAGSDYVGLAGPIPLERLLRKHHRLLIDLRASGMTWEQISRLLAGAGVVHRNGRAFPPSHLRGVFGRHRKRLGTGSPNVAAASRAQCADGSAHRQEHQESGSTTARPRRADIALKINVPSDRAGSNSLYAAVGDMSADEPDSQNRDDRNDVPRTRAMPDDDRARVLALMRQSALARRGPE
jgi:hypothetical protein